MSTKNLRFPVSSSTMPSSAKRNSSSSSSSLSANPVKESAFRRTEAGKKRAPLGDITNRRDFSGDVSDQKNGPRSSASSSAMVHSSGTICQSKNATNPDSVRPEDSEIPRSYLPPKVNAKANTMVPYKATGSANSDFCRTYDAVSSLPPLPSSSRAAMDASPARSDLDSVSLDESISTCDSFKSPEVEYMDNIDDPLERKCPSSLGKNDEIIIMGNKSTDPQICAAYASDIYKHLRFSELAKRPSLDFMETIQKDINAGMRAVLVDWLVEVAEEYRLIPETLYLSVNYIDRYLSGNVINRQKLQLLGVACMMIAAKYEEICPPQVEEFCYITDNTYFKNEVLEMESSVLNYLKFEITAPTAKCFLRRFVRAAQGTNEVLPVQLECLASYLAELSLLDYAMLQYLPSLVAASAVFLARYILEPSRKPWNSTLGNYTLYSGKDLRDCVKDLLRLYRDGTRHSCSVPAVRKKYSQHKYKFAAKKFCPASVPPEFFLG
ncbi:PREDICTED: cyclin-A1-2 isoform X2 [Tarenaya hassleriana]|uniref:cyclin-A1-2 isoform X2 n=1 Tax=Tarenaya hassleriana TaxID=28532 RepID=UPI00053C774B|nr:PREDICTED: cyclin-A1-2 isoform X2 [Tarenaya hassleriana]